MTLKLCVFCIIAACFFITPVILGCFDSNEKDPDDTSGYRMIAKMTPTGADEQIPIAVWIGVGNKVRLYEVVKYYKCRSIKFKVQPVFDVVGSLSSKLSKEGYYVMILPDETGETVVVNLKK